jgi:anti-sigma regulatory factor (Ser/Thr protein kinase)
VPRTVLSVPPLAASVAELRGLLDDQLAALAVTERCREDLAILITEASTNAVRHGQGTDAIEVAIAVDDERCVLEIANPDGSLDESKLHAGPPHAWAEGGRGLPLIGALADAVRVLRPRPGWVLVQIVKRLERRASRGSAR